MDEDHEIEEMLALQEEREQSDHETAKELYYEYVESI